MLRTLTKTIFLNRNHKYYLTNTVKLHTTNQQLQIDEVESVDNKHVNRINEILKKYTPQEEQKILEIVNNYKLNELLCYDITKGRANKLLAWRMRNGLLNNLNDIFSIEGFGLKVADKFYQSLLQEPKAIDLDLSKAGKSNGCSLHNTSVRSRTERTY
ncbi:hypothetical protein DOY81_013871 [Sarcophaga bullata]|nr:hypothetical protein DOY81_013871 [Sarcophaga bullata]